MINRILHSKSGPYFLLAATALVTLLYHIGWLPFLGNDECRYARIADEMNQSGKWVTPTLEGYPWLEKPPLYYWITVFMYRLFGVSEGAARLGPALCALLTAFSVFWVGAKLWSRSAGLVSGMIALTAVGYYAYGRSASTDMPVTASLTLALSAMAAAVLRDDRRRWLIWGAYALLGAAVLAKGPVALVLAAGILLLFWTLDEQGGSLSALHVISGSAVTLLVALPWHLLAFRENGFSFVSSYLINHNFARYVTEVHHHDQSVFYFLPVILGLLFPWSGWLPALIAGRTGLKGLDPRNWDRSVLFLSCWAVFPVLFFSLSSSKLPGYVLPSLPPLALLLGRNFEARIQNPDGFGGWKLMRWFYLIFSLAAAMAVPIIMWLDYQDTWHAGLFMGAAALLPACFAFRAALRGNFRRAVQATAVQGIMVLLAVVHFGFAPLAEYNSANEIAAKALAARAADEPIVTFAYFDQTLHYYTGYRVAANILDPVELLDFARSRPRFLIATTEQLTGTLTSMPQLEITQLAAQGKLRLLRARLVAKAPGA